MDGSKVQCQIIDISHSMHLIAVFPQQHCPWNPNNLLIIGLELLMDCRHHLLQHYPIRRFDQ